MTRRAALLVTVWGLLGRSALPAPLTADLDGQATTDPSGTGTTELEATLRRQLMVDNYDYMSSEADEFPQVHELTDGDVTPPPPPASPPALQPRLNDIFIPRAIVDDLDADEAEDAALDTDSRDLGVAKNDLLYYVSDDRLRDEHDTEEASFDPLQVNISVESTSPRVKYKIIEVRAGGGSRRAGGGAARRFVQEEGAGGVALINLGELPFPEFRLPPARRQYAAASADLELAPLSSRAGELSD